MTNLIHTGNKKILYLLLFIVVFSYFLWLNSTPSFTDPDSFYHAKASELILSSGPIKDFNWLPYTTLNDVFIDHHFFYHLLLIPFLLLLPPLVATKLAAAIFATLAIITFQWLLDRFKIAYSFIYTLILIFSHQFIFRINLAKAPSLSLIVLLLFIYLLFKNKDKWSFLVFALSFIYVWLYGGWIILVGIGILYFLINIILQLVKKVKDKKYYFKLFFSMVIGTLAGLIINPYFPINLKFYYQQTFQIGLVNYNEIVGVGGEWYGLSIFELVRHNVFSFSLFIISILLFFIYYKSADAKKTLLLAVSTIFFVLTLKSQRNIEYFIPFALLFSAYMLNSYFRANKLKISLTDVKKYLKNNRAHTIIIILFIILNLSIVLAANFKGLKNNLRKNYTFNQFEEISNWFIDNTSQGDIIFHDGWDDWPVLYYHNSENRYIVGLDPTFMYLENKRQYWRWKNIATGVTDQEICSTIADKFDSSYVLVKFTNKTLKEHIEKDALCTLVFENSDGSIYKIKY